jgi:hypothetical protein
MLPVDFQAGAIADGSRDGTLEDPGVAVGAANVCEASADGSRLTFAEGNGVAAALAQPTRKTADSSHVAGAAHRPVLMRELGPGI